LKAEGMSIGDIQPIRLSFSDMAGALARGRYRCLRRGGAGAPGISLANGNRQADRIPVFHADRFRST